MSNHLIAIDGGGTKTDYLLADLNGQILQKITHAPTSLSTSGVGLTAFNLREGIRQLLEKTPTVKIAVAVMALAGLDTPAELAQVKKVLHEVLADFHLAQIILVNDALAALVNGSQNEQAIVLISGTGTNCLGYNGQRRQQVGGFDYLLTDEGSGYDAGRLTLRAVARSYDGRGPKSLLEKLIFDHFQVRNLAELKNKVYQPLLSKGEIAILATFCHQAMKAGDRVAKAIIDHCLQELLLNVQTVVQALALPAQGFDLVLAGSFITNLQAYWRPMITTAFPRAQIIIPATPPVFGALKIAQKIHQGEKIIYF